MRIEPIYHTTRPLVNPFKLNGITLLSIGPVHFCFKGCWVVFILFIQIVIEHSVSKQWCH